LNGVSSETGLKQARSADISPHDGKLLKIRGYLSNGDAGTPLAIML
jgi:hypothetical protein